MAKVTISGFVDFCDGKMVLKQFFRKDRGTSLLSAQAYLSVELKHVQQVDEILIRYDLPPLREWVSLNYPVHQLQTSVTFSGMAALLMSKDEEIYLKAFGLAEEASVTLTGDVTFFENMMDFCSRCYESLSSEELVASQEEALFGFQAHVDRVAKVKLQIQEILS